MTTQQTSITLTQDGKPAATIVLAKQATCAARFAAAELQAHIEKISGARLRVVSDETLDIQGPRVLIGESNATGALGFCGQDFKSQEYMIRFLPDTLVLMGHDTPSPAPAFPERVAGKFGGAYRFNGKTTIINVADCNFNDAVGSLEAWVWLPAEPQDGDGTILRIESEAPFTYHLIQRDGKTNHIHYVTYDGTHGYGVASGDLAEGWHHLLATYDHTVNRIELFIDGSRVGSAGYTPTQCKGRVLGIGGRAQRRGWGSARESPFCGLIDEVRISKHVRQPELRGPFTVDPNTVLLFHFDESAGNPIDSVSDIIVSTDLPDPWEEGGWLEDHGSLDAVYDFLERYCAVRWYAPTELGVVYEKQPTVEVYGCDVCRSPAMSYRWFEAARQPKFSALHPISASDWHIWMLRMRIGGQNLTFNHSFYGYYERFLEEHPDWFARGYAGKPPQMCYTNPEFIAQVVQDASAYFEGLSVAPGASVGDDLFAIVPQDNDQWCQCARCQAEWKPEEPGDLPINDRASNYIFHFTNKVADALREQYPDKKLGQLAYMTYAHCPDQVELAPSVAVRLCLHARNWWSPWQATNDRTMLAAWREQHPEQPLSLWLYYCYPAFLPSDPTHLCFPGFYAHTIVQQMELYHATHITGIYLENSAEYGHSYLLDQLEFYVTFKLADDPTLDGNALIDEFFARYYGAAAAPMKKLYCRIEETYSSVENYPAEFQAPGWSYLFSLDEPNTEQLPAGLREQFQRHGEMLSAGAKAPLSAWRVVDGEKSYLIRRENQTFRVYGRPRHQDREIAWGWLGTEERMAEFKELMDQASAAAQTPLEQQRVEIFRAGIWNPMVEGRKKYLESKGHATVST